MKPFNLFKKKTVKNTSKIESLNKNQLQKVIGGIDAITDVSTTDDKIVKGPGKSTIGATASGA